MAVAVSQKGTVKASGHVKSADGDIDRAAVVARLADARTAHAEKVAEAVELETRARQIMRDLEDARSKAQREIDAAAARIGAHSSSLLRHSLRTQPEIQRFIDICSDAEAALRAAPSPGDSEAWAERQKAAEAIRRAHQQAAGLRMEYVPNLDNALAKLAKDAGIRWPPVASRRLLGD